MPYDHTVQLTATIQAAATATYYEIDLDDLQTALEATGRVSEGNGTWAIDRIEVAVFKNRVRIFTKDA